jgi:hypothetical protein
MHSNHALCPGGATSQFAQYFLISFYEPVGDVAWIFYIRLDAGWGLGAFYDGQLLLEADQDLYKEMELKLSKVSKGAHTLEVFMAENCCDGERGGWEFDRAGSGRKPLNTQELMGACLVGMPPPIPRKYRTMSCWHKQVFHCSYSLQLSSSIFFFGAKLPRVLDDEAQIY